MLPATKVKHETTRIRQEHSTRGNNLGSRPAGSCRCSRLRVSCCGDWPDRPGKLRPRAGCRLERHRAQVVAVADQDPKGRAAAAARLKAPSAYADYRRMLEEKCPQIVSVAPRWLDCHRDMVLAVYESHRLNAPVALPLGNRRHPLSML